MRSTSRLILLIFSTSIRHFIVCGVCLCVHSRAMQSSKHKNAFVFLETQHGRIPESASAQSRRRPRAHTPSIEGGEREREQAIKWRIKSARGRRQTDAHIKIRSENRTHNIGFRNKRENLHRGLHGPREIVCVSALMRRAKEKVMSS